MTTSDTGTRGRGSDPFRVTTRACEEQRGFIITVTRISSGVSASGVLPFRDLEMHRGRDRLDTQVRRMREYERVIRRLEEQIRQFEVDNLIYATTQ